MSSVLTRFFVLLITLSNTACYKSNNFGDAKNTNTLNSGITPPADTISLPPDEEVPITHPPSDNAPVNGEWIDNDIRATSVYVGQKSCTNPAPSNGGADCVAPTGWNTYSLNGVLYARSCINGGVNGRNVPYQSIQAYWCDAPAGYNNDGTKIGGGPILNRGDPRCTGEAANIFIVAGQSNALGLGKISETYNQWQWNFWTQNGFGFKYWDFSINTEWQQGYYGITQTGSFGPELILTASLQSAGWKNIYIYKAAFGGASLAPSTQDQNHWLWRGYGGHYDRVIPNIKGVADNICQSGLRPIVKGIFWMQGESDAYYSLNHASGYAHNLGVFIDQMRQDIAEPTTPFIIGKIKSNWTYSSILRDQQDQVAAQKANVKTIETDDLTVTEDTVHYNSEGQLYLGWRFYESFSTLSKAGL